MSQDDLDKDIAFIAYQSRLHFPSIDTHDVAQELQLWVLAHPETVERYADEPAKLRKSLRNAAAKFCVREHARQVGYQPEDVYYYSIEQLKDILPNAFDSERWTALAVDRQAERTTGGGRPSEGGNALTALIDVSIALSELKPFEQLLLRERFEEDIEFHVLGPRHGETDEGMRKRVDRLLRKMQRSLGGSRPDGLGTREVISNADGQARVRDL